MYICEDQQTSQYRASPRSVDSPVRRGPNPERNGSPELYEPQSDRLGTASLPATTSPEETPISTTPSDLPQDRTQGSRLYAAVRQTGAPGTMSYDVKLLAPWPIQEDLIWLYGGAAADMELDIIALDPNGIVEDLRMGVLLIAVRDTEGDRNSERYETILRVAGSWDGPVPMTDIRILEELVARGPYVPSGHTQCECINRGYCCSCNIGSDRIMRALHALDEGPYKPLEDHLDALGIPATERRGFRNAAEAAILRR